MSGITWIASYPKSGNTWVRIFLATLLSGRPPELQTLNFAPRLGLSREAFEEFLHLDASDLTERDIQRWRPALTRALAAELPAPIYMKTHDARVLTDNGEPLVPTDVTAAVVYLVRDPRDIAPSLAHHLGCDVDKAISIMGDETYVTPSYNRGLHFLLGDYWSSWSNNVRSWLDADGPPALVLHYETLLAEPEAAFTMLAKHLGIVCDAQSLAAAIDATRFECLQTAERLNGFPGQTAPGRMFFREGRAGGWRDVLSATQAARIEADHGAFMRRLGYLPGLKTNQDCGV